MFLATTRAVTLALLGALACAPLAAQAQEGTAAPRPDRTTASYGDWVLRCELPAGGERRCEVAQTIQDQRGQPLAYLTARGVAPGQVVVMIQVGTNITVTEPARLMLDDQPALALAFRRCTPRGCFASAQLPQNETAALARRTEAAKLDFRDAEGQVASFPISLRGLAAALDALHAAAQG